VAALDLGGHDAPELQASAESFAAFGGLTRIDQEIVVNNHGKGSSGK
jgi:hypothetical protein